MRAPSRGESEAELVIRISPPGQTGLVGEPELLFADRIIATGMEAPPPGGRGDDGPICRVGGPAWMHDQLKHEIRSSRTIALPLKAGGSPEDSGLGRGCRAEVITLAQSSVTGGEVKAKPTMP